MAFDQYVCVSVDGMSFPVVDLDVLATRCVKQRKVALGTLQAILQHEKAKVKTLMCAA